MRIFTVFIFYSLFSQSFSQDDFAWWNEAHNYDGYNHWTDYIIYSPYYLGPNALTVPSSKKGKINNKIELTTEYINHFSPGDNTQSIFMSLSIPLLKDKIAIEFYGVPFESYRMNYETVLERRARYQDGKGTATGDFYFSTIIQLLKKEKLPEVALRLAGRTASGNNLGSARYTDAPGYFFDVSLGKDYRFGKKEGFLVRLHMMLGFYSWQMNLPDNKQNDAILFGMGADAQYNSWFINNVLEGYAGYFGEEMVIVGDTKNPVPYNDRPVIYRISAGKELDWIRLSIGYQLAIHHFQYDYLKASVTFLF
jgi:hypothetical protein